MRNLSTVIFIALALAACGDGRWVPNTPHEAQLADPQVTFNAALQLLRSRGYQIVEMDPPRGYIRVQSMLDGDTRIVGGFGSVALVNRVSHIMFQVAPNGRLVVTAMGYHVRDNNTVMHRKLAEEIDDLLKAICGMVPRSS
jgi:hypothetical protein